MILILSRDPTAAALLGGLVETLGYAVRFARPPETPDESMRRTRPRLSLVDCLAPDACSDETLGRAAMRGVSVVIFGTPEALDRVRAVVVAHHLETLLMPPEPDELEAALQRVLAGAPPS